MFCYTSFRSLSGASLRRWALVLSSPRIGLRYCWRIAVSFSLSLLLVVFCAFDAFRREGVLQGHSRTTPFTKLILSVVFTYYNYHRVFINIIIFEVLFRIYEK